MNNDLYYYDIIRKNIRYYRKLKGYTFQRLADESELSIEHLQKIESMKDRRTFSITVLGRVADTLKVPIQDFFIIRETEE